MGVSPGQPWKRDTDCGTRRVPLTFRSSHTRRAKNKEPTTRQYVSIYKIGAFLCRARRRKAGAQGFEPCVAALETACSPRSTLLFNNPRVSGGNRTRRLDLHRVACQPLHHRHHPSAEGPGTAGYVEPAALP